MRDDDLRNDSVGNDVKAVAQDVLRLGARCVQAGRAWLNDRREEMTNRNDDNRRESQSYGRSGSNPRQEFGSQARNESGRYESDSYAPSSQFANERYGADRYESAGQQGSQPWGNEGRENGYQQASGMSGERYGQFAPRNEFGSQGLHSQEYSGYRSQESMGYGGDYQPYRQRGYGYQEELRGQGQGYGTSSGYNGRDNLQGHRYGSASGYEGAGYPQQGQRDFGSSSLRGQDTGYGLGSREYGDRSTPSAYSQGSLGQGLESGRTASLSGAQPYMGQRMSGVGQASYRGRGPKNYTRSDDRIIDDVNERLTNDDDLDASDIEVKCESGVLTLEGTVEQRWMKHRAEDLAEACAGVRQIDNRIQVETSSHYASGDLSQGLSASSSRGSQSSRKESGNKGASGTASTSGSGSSQH